MVSGLVSAVSPWGWRTAKRPDCTNSLTPPRFEESLRPRVEPAGVGWPVFTAAKPQTCAAIELAAPNGQRGEQRVFWGCFAARGHVTALARVHAR